MATDLIKLRSVLNNSGLQKSNNALYQVINTLLSSTRDLIKSVENIPTAIEGMWTPAITFATPGDLAVTYAGNIGYYTKIDKEITLNWILLTSAFTHTTAAGDLRITGLPFLSTIVTNYFRFGSMQWQGITKAGYTDILPRIDPNVQFMKLIASGSGQVNAVIGAADMPTGGALNLSGTITYRIP